MSDEYEKPYITASEIGQYQYCSLAWYFKKSGYKPHSTSLQKGIQLHSHYGKQLKRKKISEYISTLCLFLGFLGFVFILLLLFFEGLL